LCLTVLYTFYILYYILAYIQHNRDVLLEKSRAIPVLPLFLYFIVFIPILALTMRYFCRVRSQSHVGGRKLLCGM